MKNSWGPPASLPGSTRAFLKMADVSVDLQSKNADELVNVGIRAYILRDYNAAVTALSRASELMVAEHGEKHDSLGNVYLYYGKALLEVSREEAEPLGDAVARDFDSDDDEAAAPENAAVQESETNMNGSSEAKAEADEAAKPADGAENGHDKGQEEPAAAANEPSSSGISAPENSGEAKGAEEVGESTEKADDEPTDLQLAWEILELAKLIFEQRADVGKKELADTLVTLGEVSMESENFEGAVADIKQGLEIQKQILAPDSRNLAETYYKLAVALSTNNQINEAIENFNISLDVLKARIVKLKQNEEEEQDEIKEIEALIPEIEEKIADMKSYKEEAEKVASVIANKKLASEATPDGGSSSRQVNDISHLVKRKRKIDEVAEQSEETPAKKMSPSSEPKS